MALARIGGADSLAELSESVDDFWGGSLVNGSCPGIPFGIGWKAGGTCHGPCSLGWSRNAMENFRGQNLWKLRQVDCSKLQRCRMEASHQLPHIN